MQAGIERRGPEVPRVPLDLWVRLSHEDYEEPFDADGVDVSSGGLALLCDYLPEVGDRLSCRFDCPPSGGEIEIDGEVVWAHDAGARSGQFGLRFDDMDVASNESLRQLVEHLGGEARARPLARLHLDGVATPVDAEVVERRDGWLTVEQELPFLQLGMGVAVEGPNGVPRGRLATVELRLEGGVPRLVLGVAHDTIDAAPSASARTVDGTEPATLEGLSAGVPPTRDDGPIASLAHPEAAEATLQDVALPVALRGVEIVDAPLRETAQVFPIERGSRQVEARHVEARQVETRHAEEPSDASYDLDEPGELTPGEGSFAGLRAEADVAEAEVGSDRVAALKAKLAPTLARMSAQLSGASRRLGPAAATVKTRLAGLGAKARPMLAAFIARLVALVSAAGRAIAEKGGPKTKRFFARLGAAAGGALAKVTSRIAPRKARRRTTESAPRQVVQSPRRRQRGEEPAAEPKKNGRRVLALSVLAFLGVGAAVYALTGGEETPAATPASDAPPLEVLAPVAAPVVSPPPAPAPEAVDDVAAALAGPSAAAEPAPEAGRLGEPSYPTLRDATAQTEGAVSEGESFGATEVPDGRSATIRMSQEVTTVRGQRQADGFTVTVPGALALDRAGPIAAANPSVERAMILNRGDHSVLTVRFVAGRNPAYRVTARGRAVEVTIGR